MGLQNIFLASFWQSSTEDHPLVPRSSPCCLDFAERSELAIKEGSGKGVNVQIKVSRANIVWDDSTI